MEANRERSVYMDRDDVVWASPSSVEFVGRVDSKEHLFALAGVVPDPAQIGNL
jgi:streptogramin lyase